MAATWLQKLFQLFPRVAFVAVNRDYSSWKLDLGHVADLGYNLCLALLVVDESQVRVSCLYRERVRSGSYQTLGHLDRVRLGDVLDFNLDGHFLRDFFGVIFNYAEGAGLLAELDVLASCLWSVSD